MADVWLFKNDPLWYRVIPVPSKALFELIPQPRQEPVLDLPDISRHACKIVDYVVYRHG
jgi:hypothetical protein